MKGRNKSTLPEAHRYEHYLTSKVDHDARVTITGYDTSEIGGGSIVKYDAPARKETASLVCYDMDGFRNIQKLGVAMNHKALAPRPAGWGPAPTDISWNGYTHARGASWLNNWTQQDRGPGSKPVWSPTVVMNALRGEGPVIAKNANLLGVIADALRRRLPAAEDLRPRQEWGAEGHTLDAMRAMNGDWDHAFRRTKRRARVSSPVVTLMVTPGGCQQCMMQVCPVTDASQLLMWAAPMVAAALLLEEAGWRVRVQVGLLTSTGSSGGPLQGSVITVKEAHDRVDLRVLAAACATQQLQFGAYGVANGALHRGNHEHGGVVLVVKDEAWGSQLGSLWQEATGGAVVGRLPEMTGQEVHDFFQNPSAATVPVDLVDSALELIRTATGGHLMEVRAAGREG